MNTVIGILGVLVCLSLLGLGCYEATNMTEEFRLAFMGLGIPSLIFAVMQFANLIEY